MRRWRGWWGRRSLRARLTLAASATVALGLLAGGTVLGGALTRREIARLDGAARGRAEVVRQLAEADRLPGVLPVDAAGADLVEVVDAAGRVLAASPSASRTLALLPPEQLAAWPRGVGRSYADRRLTGAALRVVVIDATLNGRPVSVVAAVPLGDVQATTRATRAGLALFLGGLVLAVAGGAWALAGSALRPVEELRRGAERIRDLGGGGVLVVPPGSDEVARLAGTLNGMLDRLAEAGARQRRFVADAAHELRSPVTALRTELEVAAVTERDDAGRGEGSDLVGELLPEVLRLGRLIDDLLVLARLDEGVAALRPEAVDLAALAAEAGEEVQRSAAARPLGDGLAQREVQIAVHGAGTARSDARATRRILRNLIENARRHARSRVLVTVTPGGVVVADDGSGVPEDERERVFARFTRLDEARARDSGGSGLGLAIARELATAGGGDLTLDRAELGGAAFELRLPSAAPGPSSPAEGSRRSRPAPDRSRVGPGATGAGEPGPQAWRRVGSEPEGSGSAAPEPVATDAEG